MHTATRAPFLTFVRTHAEPPLRRVETTAYSPLQKSGSFPTAAMGYDRLLCKYQSFIDAAIECYQDDYRGYVQRGGKDSFFHRCWGLLLNEAMKEADALLKEEDRCVQNKEMLLQDLKRISEGCLLVLDRALA